MRLLLTCLGTLWVVLVTAAFFIIGALWLTDVTYWGLAWMVFGLLAAVPFALYYIIGEE